MKKNKLDLRVLHNRIDYGENSQGLYFIRGLLIHKWEPNDFNISLYTEGELRKLHRSFGHPSSSSLAKLLQRARPEQFNADVQKYLEDITKSCVPCQFHSRKPRRFKLAVGTDELRFNHIVAVDVMYIDGEPVLHIVDEATHFMSACFLRNSSTKEVWASIRKCWINVYLGPPDFLRVDQGSNLVSSEFKESAAGLDIVVLDAPVESPSTMSHVERYHEPLRTAFRKISHHLGGKETKFNTLQMAVKSVNDTIGPEGLCPTLLVFGAVPRPARVSPSPDQIDRAKAVENAMKAVEKEHARRKVLFGQRHRGPYGRERLDLMKLPHGADVLIFREKQKKWTGPHKFISIEGDTVVVQLPHGRKIFRSHVVKPYHHHKDENQGLIASEFKRKGTGQSYRERMKPNDQHTFKAARQAEIQGLKNRNVFKVVKLATVPKGTRIQNTRFVDELRVDEKGNVCEKSRLVAKNFFDPGASTIATKSPTVTRIGQRVVLTSAAQYPKHKFYLRDVKQAFTQAKSNVERPIYLNAPKEFGLKEDELLLVEKPLYGIPEAGLHWFATYHGHHLDDLKMEESVADRCLLFRRKDSCLEAVTVLQVDDSAGHGNESFMNEEEQGSKTFTCKPRKFISTGQSASFNGCVISKTENGYTMTQPDKLMRMQDPVSQSEAISTRAALQYVAGCTRPDLCSSTQLLSSDVQNCDEKTIEKLCKITKRARETSEIGLNFVELDLDSLQYFLFTDASFANASNGASQIGFVLCLADSSGKANIVHFGSQRCKRVTRSVMAAELLALNYGFDNAYLGKKMLEEIFELEIPLKVFIDSRTVFNTVTKGSSTLEKRLQIEAYALRQSYNRGELNQLSWIPSEQNIADALTKGLPSIDHALYRVMKTNKLHVQKLGWVDHVKKKKKKQ